MARPTQNNGPDPALIFIHGGGWKSGGRGQFYDEIGDAAQDGYVAVTITHRLTEPTTADGQVKYPWPAAIHDVKCSIRYLRANASRFHLDPHKIGITGHSSGGHLALMAGLTDKSDSLEGPGGHQEVSSRVQAVVSMSGVTAMSTFYYVPDLTPYVERLMGGAPDQYPERYMEASPVHYVSSDDPPVMSIHGEDDETVPIAQPKALDRAFEAFPVSHRLVILKNQSHVYEGEGRSGLNVCGGSFSIST